MAEQHENDRHPLADIDRLIHAPARLMIMTYLYVVNKADYVYLMRLTGLTWGNIASHIGKLEESNYVEIEKKFVGKKPHSLVKMTPKGKNAYKNYKNQMQETFNNLP